MAEQPQVNEIEEWDFIERPLAAKLYECPICHSLTTLYGRYEPIPSSRDDEYIARCRWDDWEMAALMADRMLAAELEGGAC